MEAVLFQAGGALGGIVGTLQNMGFFLYLFPFLLSLAIIYGVLTYAMGDKLPRSASGLIAIVISFFVMLYASINTQIVQFFANLSGVGLIVGSGILFLIILFGMLGFKTEELFKGKNSKWVFIFGIIVILILIFFAAGADQFGLVPQWATTQEFFAVAFFIVIIALAMWWLGGGNGGGGGAAGGGAAPR